MKTKNIPLAVYVDKDTPVHRLRASWKLLFIIVFVITTSLLATTPLRGLLACGIAVAFYFLAAIPPRVALSQLWPPLLIVVPLAAFQWWAKDLDYALTMFLSIFSAILIAFLLTLTSTVDEIMDSVETSLAPLGRFGFPVENVTLAMSLTIRLIPLMFATVGEVLDARKARGAGFSISAFGTPVLIRSIRRARAIGEALQARGFGD